MNQMMIWKIKKRKLIKFKNKKHSQSIYQNLILNLLHNSKISQLLMIYQVQVHLTNLNKLPNKLNKIPNLVSPSLITYLVEIQVILLKILLKITKTNLIAMHSFQILTTLFSKFSKLINNNKIAQTYFQEWHSRTNNKLHSNKTNSKLNNKYSLKYKKLPRNRTQIKEMHGQWVVV